MSESEIPPGVSVEGIFVVEARYTQEAAGRRPAVRAEHLSRVAELIRDGVVIEAGAYSDALTSSLLLVHAADAQAALDMFSSDVYVRAGVWGELSARPFGRVIADVERPDGPGP
jgi:uncharacterized protein YciI